MDHGTVLLFFFFFCFFYFRPRTLCCIFFPLLHFVLSVFHLLPKYPPHSLLAPVRRLFQPVCWR
ncbi:hypothetical protein HBI56_211290 [Parastagonospora nodorum]|uniref:Uncharacterized protein n=1 Tax=Phaeosphaeria nodorum (strain SN15 / ATCC MYA-4574 / FGSC 10173) TaxID=321614 RepID=A0A7U2F373_PHANO|nr:hypothetical protein HBH56_213080 [Parastagonospora nodorum]QRC97884.1 hypothetical protein JI435_411200 [Parastagonospora nodorum SN15]KAH3923049.1 hypothetical protein HBH54_214750 [Parastagonospora nodorum]KAH3941789.1 hypothetical protein HBH53_197340 [Parastagonospora nodorum]KAH3960948.1 hypothetical protein HBH51_187160 [Parastagonospora nodorum]